MDENKTQQYHDLMKQRKYREAGRLVEEEENNKLGLFDIMQKYYQEKKDALLEKQRSQINSNKEREDLEKFREETPNHIMQILEILLG